MSAAGGGRDGAAGMGGIDMAAVTPFGERLGLVLEGGAMRGIYTAGVLDVFMEEGILADVVVGVSAGALHGCSYVSGQKGRSIRFYRNYRRDKHFMGLYSLLTTGELVGSKFCYEEIPMRLDPFDEKAFEAAPMDFYVTVTNLYTGKAEYILCDELRLDSKMKVIRAGASMPLCSRPVAWNGGLYLDGGVADSIPYAKMPDFGCRRSIVVLTQPEHYLKKPVAMAPFRMAYRRYPAFIEAMHRRDQVYNTEVCAVEQAARNGKAFLIRPSRAVPISRMERDIEVIDTQYELGRRDAAAAMPALRRWLAD